MLHSRPRRGGLTGALLDRQLSGREATSAPRPYMASFSCRPEDGGGVIAVNPGGVATPAFCAKYNQRYCDCRLLALADEEGCLSVVETGGAALPSSLYADAGAGPAPPPSSSAAAGGGALPRPRAQWLCHNNAVFDLAWARDDTRILTASGDQTVGLWDSLEARALGSCRGHRGSVKAVAPCPGAPDVFASGGRDGCLLLWDARVPGRGGGGGGGGGGGAGPAEHSPVAAVAAAHGAPASAGAPRRGGPPGAGRAAPHSVTAAAFLADGRVLASGGADGAVRLWDVRALRTGGGGGGRGGLAATAAVAAVCPVTAAADDGGWPAAPCAPSAAATPTRSANPRPHGVCGLALDPSAGARLAATVQARGHFLVDAGRLAAGGGLGGADAAASTPHHARGAVIALHPDCPGAAPSSFYVKAAFSGDGTHVVGGGGDGCGRVWHTARPWEAPARLVGHAAEVTGVAWCPTDGGEVATCSDDATVRLWRLVRRTGDEWGEGGDDDGWGGGVGRGGGGAPPAPAPAQPPPHTPAAGRPAPASPPASAPVAAGGTGGRGWPGAAAPRLPPATAPRLSTAAARPPPTAARLAQRSIFDFVSPLPGGGHGGGGGSVRPRPHRCGDEGVEGAAAAGQENRPPPQQQEDAAGNGNKAGPSGV